MGKSLMSSPFYAAGLPATGSTSSQVNCYKLRELNATIFKHSTIYVKVLDCGIMSYIRMANEEAGP